MTARLPFTNPEHQRTAFNCPHCGAYANMLWFKPLDKTIRSVPQGSMKDTEVAKCTACQNFSHWVNNVMVYPIFETQIEDPNEDLPEEVKADYIEAASIVASSPRGAAALLRLAIQKLCDELVSESGDLSFKIGMLVESGLNKKIQQALDIVRVVGNNAVHPGQIDLNDKPEVAKQLFLLVNMIAQQMITEPAEVDAMFESLPEAAKEAVKNRDKK